jgi:hypothetical protein
VVTSAPAPSAPASSAAPSIVTVTTTISNTPYQCACTPSPIATTSGTLTCPAANGMTYTSACGAKYVVECSVDRFGDDSKYNQNSQRWKRLTNIPFQFQTEELPPQTHSMNVSKPAVIPPPALLYLG